MTSDGLPAAIQASIQASIQTKERLLKACVADIQALCEAAVQTLRGGGKLFFCGNGGSACDAAHAVGELVGWFERKDRKGYAAIALGHEVPTLTAVANDVGFAEVFARQLNALGRPEDMLIGISTSGSSANVIKALEAAQAMGMKTGALVSVRPGPMADLAEIAVRVPSEDTARIQENHLLCVHLLCAAVEQAIEPA
ncbi:MAG: D-sedoheptulose-7-phosphate isomerase [Planctomycetota bacterium]|jgi:D-sedoheptulose 7-phosphate isomerase